MSAEYPSDWDSRRRDVYQRDNHTCQNCGAMGGPNGHAELHAHHIVPKSRGGTHATSNLITLCKDCHNTVHNKSMQAPDPAQSIGSQHLDYPNLSDAIIEDCLRLLVDGGDEMLNIFDPSTNMDVDIQARETLQLTAEYRQTMLEITDAISTLENLPKGNYPQELIEADKQAIEAGEQAITDVLDVIEGLEEALLELTELLTTCPECDAELHEDDKYCGECGAKIDIYPVCQNCGSEITPPDDFCRDCGEPIEKDQMMHEQIDTKIKASEQALEEFKNTMIEVSDEFLEQFNKRAEAVEKALEEHSRF